MNRFSSDITVDSTRYTLYVTVCRTPDVPEPDIDAQLEIHDNIAITSGIKNEQICQ